MAAGSDLCIYLQHVKVSPFLSFSASHFLSLRLPPQIYPRYTNISECNLNSPNILSLKYTHADVSFSMGNLHKSGVVSNAQGFTDSSTSHFTALMAQL